MTTEVLIANLQGNHTALVSIVNNDGKVSRHLHVELGQFVKALIYDGQHVVIGEKPATFTYAEEKAAWPFPTSEEPGPGYVKQD